MPVTQRGSIWQLGELMKRKVITNIRLYASLVVAQIPDEQVFFYCKTRLCADQAEDIRVWIHKAGDEEARIHWINEVVAPLLSRDFRVTNISNASDERDKDNPDFYLTVLQGKYVTQEPKAPLFCDWFQRLCERLGTIEWSAVDEIKEEHFVCYRKEWITLADYLSRRFLQPSKKQATVV